MDSKKELQERRAKLAGEVSELLDIEIAEGRGLSEAERMRYAEVSGAARYG